MKSNTNDSHKEKTILAHLDVNQVAELICASYNLTLDDNYDIVVNHPTGKKTIVGDWVENLLPVTKTEHAEIDVFDDYNYYWLEALTTLIRLKLMARRGENSRYIIKKHNETM